MEMWRLLSMKPQVAPTQTVAVSMSGCNFPVSFTLLVWPVAAQSHLSISGGKTHNNNYRGGLSIYSVQLLEN